MAPLISTIPSPATSTSGIWSQRRLLACTSLYLSPHRIVQKTQLLSLGLYSLFLSNKTIAVLQWAQISLTQTTILVQRKRCQGFYGFHFGVFKGVLSTLPKNSIWKSIKAFVSSCQVQQACQGSWASGYWFDTAEPTCRPYPESLKQERHTREAQAVKEIPWLLQSLRHIQNCCTSRVEKIKCLAIWDFWRLWSF